MPLRAALASLLVGGRGGTEKPARTGAAPLSTAGTHSSASLALLALLVGVLEQVGRFLPAQLPRRHLDISWMMGLELAREQDLRHGSDLVFTYGPWGFLASPTGIDLTTQIASGVMRVLAVGLLFMALTISLRRWRGHVVAATCLALLISNAGQPDWILMLAIMVWTLTCLSRSTDLPIWSVALGAAVGALLIQVKLTVGLMTLVLVGLLVLSHRQRARVLAAATGTFVAAFVILWLLAGQSLTALPRWLRLGWEIIAGYSDAMGYFDTNVLMIVMVVSVLVGVAVAGSARPLGWLARLGCVGALLFFAKLALGLPDGGHLIPGYAGVAAVLAVLLGMQLPRPARWGAVTTLVCLSVFLSVGSPVIPGRDLSLASVPLGASAGDRTDRLSTARAALVADLGIEPAVLAALEDHPVSVDPWEISAVWAHELEWRPLTVFQQYSAYTPRLDRENVVSLLADPDHRVLRERVSDHDYNPVWVTPAYTLALVCNFEAVVTEGEWSALARGADRCGDERSVSSRRVAAGEEVTLGTSTTSLVAVRFEPDPRALTDRLLGVTGVQRHLLHATLDGVRFRIAEAQATGPLIIGTPDAEPVLFDMESARSISFDRAGELEIIEIPFAGGESE